MYPMGSPASLRALVRRPPVGTYLVVAPTRVDIGDQRPGLAGERGRRHQRLGVDPGRQVGRPVVRVDEPVDVASEAQPEQQVASDD
jgi:hypothetical protein